jgi:exodeoxyribonuclease VII small subunit
MPSKPSKEPDQSFETAIDRLEQIVEEMESDRLPLEQLLARYEEGTRLVKVCQEKLDDAERRIEIITRNAGGKPQISEFDPTAQSPAAGAPVTSVPSQSSAKPASRTSSPDDDEEVSLF